MMAATKSREADTAPDAGHGRQMMGDILDPRRTHPKIELNTPTVNCLVNYTSVDPKQIRKSRSYFIQRQQVSFGHPYLHVLTAAPQSARQVGGKCKLIGPKAPKVGDKCGTQVWETSVNSCGPRHPEWEIRETSRRQV